MVAVLREQLLRSQVNPEIPCVRNFCVHKFVTMCGHERNEAPGPTAEPRWLDEAEMRVWRNLIDLWDELQRDLDADLAPRPGHGARRLPGARLPVGGRRPARCACATSPTGSTCRRAGSPVGSTGWCRAGWSPASPRPTTAGSSLAVHHRRRHGPASSRPHPTTCATSAPTCSTISSRTDIERLGTILERLRRSRAEAAGQTLP